MAQKYEDEESYARLGERSGKAPQATKATTL